MGGFACAFCGQAKSSAGPMTPTQAQHIIDGSRGKRVVAGGDGKLRQHPTVSTDRVGKPVHVLAVLRDGLTPPGDSDPWFECRVSGETPGPGSIYPVYPLSAIEPYDPTEDARRYAQRREFLASLDARLDQGAKDYGEKSFSRSLPELLGELEQELLDQAGWAYVSWCKIQRMKAALVEAQALTESDAP